MLSRKLFSVLTTVAIAGTALIAPAISTPLARAAEVTAAQASPEIPDPQLFTYPSTYLLQGDTDTFTPLSDDLPAGTTLTLDEGTALEELRAGGWSISVADNILTVTAPRHAEGYYQIPVIITFPDQSTQTTAVTMNVDYLAHIPLSILIPAAAYAHLSESSISSTSSVWP
ncbi:Rib/alpha-like domain-containing protein [Corynebacterium sp. A21]|uniref:Rib/alpha-like domain-containing protein n=1 Tax=Corynebacterium sp. A21 TaxID=3457318 RepID=UPI003FD4D354